METAAVVWRKRPCWCQGSEVRAGRLAIRYWRGGPNKVASDILYLTNQTFKPKQLNLSKIKNHQNESNHSFIINFCHHLFKIFLFLPLCFNSIPKFQRLLSVSLSSTVTCSLGSGCEDPTANRNGPLRS